MDKLDFLSLSLSLACISLSKDFVLQVDSAFLADPVQVCHHQDVTWAWHFALSIVSAGAITLYMYMCVYISPSLRLGNLSLRASIAFYTPKEQSGHMLLHRPHEWLTMGIPLCML